MGTSRPNPSVGAVVVCQNKIIGEGFTSVYGKNHAEVNAIYSVKNKALLKEATLYVTLEPCAHFGKTPPCVNLIIKHKIPNVVIGCIDTNSLVAGKGVEILKNAGVNVTVGVLKDKCLEHHKRFFMVQNKKRPYVILKWAQTQDRFIAPINKEKIKPVWISNKYSQQLVHKWRSKEHAVLVGTNTVLVDNPKLNVRSWFGQNPIRVVLDKSLKISKSTNILDESIKTIVITKKRSKKNKTKPNVFFEEIDFSNNVAEQVCQVLQAHKIQSVIIEGGTQTLQTFIKANLWDEAKIFTSNVLFKSGVKAPVISGKVKKEKKIVNDTLQVLTPYKSY